MTLEEIAELGERVAALEKAMAAIRAEFDGRPAADGEGSSTKATDKKKYHRAEDLPDVITPYIMATYAHIGRSRIYELMDILPEAGGIPSFNVGSTKLAAKEDFLAWIEDRKAEKLQKMIARKEAAMHAVLNGRLR